MVYFRGYSRFIRFDCLRLTNSSDSSGVISLGGSIIAWDGDWSAAQWARSSIDPPGLRKSVRAMD